MQVLRGVAAVATILLGGLLLSMAAHLVLAPLPVVASWGLLGAIVVGTLWAGWRWFIKPLRSRITLVQMARWLETRHPEIQERVSTALELAGDASGGVSESLLEELVTEAQGDVREVDPSREVRARRAKRWLWPATGLAAIFVLVFVIFPGEAQRLLVRAVAPFSDLGNAGAVRFSIDPKDIRVLEGDEVKITIAYSDSEAEELILIMDREGEEPLTETLKRAGVEDGVSRFDYRLPAAKESFHYYAQVGKAQSDGYDVTVSPLPRMEKVQVSVDFPDYTDQSSQRSPLGRGVSALGGSAITVEGMTTPGVEGGRFLLDGEEVGTVSVAALSRLPTGVHRTARPHHRVVPPFTEGKQSPGRNGLHLSSRHLPEKLHDCVPPLFLKIEFDRHRGALFQFDLPTFAPALGPHHGPSIDFQDGPGVHLHPEAVIASYRRNDVSLPPDLEPIAVHPAVGRPVLPVELDCGINTLDRNPASLIIRTIVGSHQTTTTGQGQSRTPARIHVEIHSARTSQPGDKLVDQGHE